MSLCNITQRTYGCNYSTLRAEWQDFTVCCFLLDCAMKCHVRCKYLGSDSVLLAQQKVQQKQSNRNMALAKNFGLNFKRLGLLLLTDCAALSLQFSL